MWEDAEVSYSVFPISVRSMDAAKGPFDTECIKEPHKNNECFSQVLQVESVFLALIHF